MAAAGSIAAQAIKRCDECVRERRRLGLQVPRVSPGESCQQVAGPFGAIGGDLERARVSSCSPSERRQAEAKGRGHGPSRNELPSDAVVVQTTVRRP